MNVGTVQGLIANKHTLRMGKLDHPKLLRLTDHFTEWSAKKFMP